VNVGSRLRRLVITGSVHVAVSLPYRGIEMSLGRRATRCIVSTIQQDRIARINRYVVVVKVPRGQQNIGRSEVGERVGRICRELFIFLSVLTFGTGNMVSA
jgi:hypothetical protein